MAKLGVYWNSTLCGYLETTSNLGMFFSYSDNCIRPISISLPLEKKLFKEKECMPFFSGLLPEGDIREKIAKAKHIPST